ncbi:MAG TPA: MerR family transcriptional regulator [Methylocystis sp.]|nr:MerR family transcriptional regulator [Methylocystis sp.]
MAGKNEEAFRSIGEVAEDLDLPPHVLRFWETRFEELDPVKRAGGRRFYRARDVELLKALRHLLYGKGYTIKGVQRLLREQGARALVESVQSGRALEPATAEAPPPRAEPPELPPPLQERLEPVVSLAPAPNLPALIAEPFQSVGLSEEDEKQLRLALADLAEARRLLMQGRE